MCFDQRLIFSLSKCCNFLSIDGRESEFRLGMRGEGGGDWGGSAREGEVWGVWVSSITTSDSWSFRGEVGRGLGDIGI